MSSEEAGKTVARAAGHGMGNGLFAATNIAMGQEILRIQKPFVAVLDSPRLWDTCSACFGIRRLQRNRGLDEGGHDDDLKACTRCQVVHYCDKVRIFHYQPVKSSFSLLILVFYRPVPLCCARGSKACTPPETYLVVLRFSSLSFFIDE
jgi:hypothetical protein